MKVELIDLKQRFKHEEKTIMKIVHKVLSKGNLILTKEVQNFENRFVNIQIQNIVLV